MSQSIIYPGGGISDRNIVTLVDSSVADVCLAIVWCLAKINIFILP